jgi:hypothetical protein
MRGFTVLMLFVTGCAAGFAAPAAENLASDTRQDAARQVSRDAAWIRNGKDILHGFGNMYHPCVLQTEDTEWPLRMWFFGWATEDCNPGYSGCDAIYHARGRDLDTWEVWCGDDVWDASMAAEEWQPVLTAQAKPWDGWHNGDPSVVLHGGRYYMAYSATGKNADGINYGMPGDTDGDLYCVMGAVSEDGIVWKRSQKPLLIYEPEIGAETAHGDAFLHGMYHRPSLLFEGGKWRLWFDYWSGSSVAMGYAEALENAFMAGDFTVLSAGKHPLLEEWPNPAIIKVAAQYYGYADPSGYGSGWAGRQLAEAVSKDGLDWKILGWMKPDSDTPACHVPVPMRYREKEKTWLVLFYSCQIGGEPYDFRYNRIRYMKRDITGEAGSN